MDFFYVVTQSWIDSNGNPGNQGFFFKGVVDGKPAENRAASKYHDILRTGAVSDDQYCSAIVMRSDGAIVKPYEYYDRRVYEEVPANNSEE